MRYEVRLVKLCEVVLRAGQGQQGLRGGVAGSLDEVLHVLCRRAPPGMQGHSHAVRGGEGLARNDTFVLISPVTIVDGSEGPPLPMDLETEIAGRL